MLGVKPAVKALRENTMRIPFATPRGASRPFRILTAQISPFVQVERLVLRSPPCQSDEPPKVVTAVGGIDSVGAGDDSCSRSGMSLE